jgi:hypothetical protein
MGEQTFLETMTKSSSVRLCTVMLEAMGTATADAFRRDCEAIYLCLRRHAATLCACLAPAVEEAEHLRALVCHSPPTLRQSTPDFTKMSSTTEMSPFSWHPRTSPLSTACPPQVDHRCGYRDGLLLDDVKAKCAPPPPGPCTIGYHGICDLIPSPRAYIYHAAIAFGGVTRLMKGL